MVRQMPPEVPDIRTFENLLGSLIESLTHFPQMSLTLPDLDPMVVETWPVASGFVPRDERELIPSEVSAALAKIQAEHPVPKGISPELAAAIRWIFTEWANDPRPDREKPVFFPAMMDAHYGWRVDLANNQLISTVPGGLSLWLSGQNYGTPVLALDFAHDVDDRNLEKLRAPIQYVADELGIEYVPMSMAAFSRVSGGYHTIKLIDRDGLNCVFSCESRGESGKAAYFISGYDENEDPPLYFLARLPHSVKSHKEGIEALKPKSVKEAEKLGLSVLRQGDMFFIPTPYRKEDLKIMGATFTTELLFPKEAYVGKRWATYNTFSDSKEDKDFDFYILHDGTKLAVDDQGMIHWTEKRRRGLYGTAHTADQIAFLPDGTQFAKGQVRHDPRSVLDEHRDADHVPLQLPGTKWYLVAKNTVPVAKS